MHSAHVASNAAPYKRATRPLVRTSHLTGGAAVGSPQKVNMASTHQITASRIVEQDPLHKEAPPMPVSTPDLSNQPPSDPWVRVMCVPPYLAQL